jgi:hypothetical protein
MDRSPAELAGHRADRELGGVTGGDAESGVIAGAVLDDIMCFTDYDVRNFHRSATPSHRLSLTSEASIAAVSHELLLKEVPLCPRCPARSRLPPATIPWHAESALHPDCL